MIRYSYVFIVVFAVIFSAIASSDKNMAREYYALGLKLFNDAENASEEKREELYSAAKDQFINSLSEWEHPQTSYFLSIVSWKLRDLDSTIEYAQMARELHPPELDTKYHQSISNLLKWANTRKDLKKPAEDKQGGRWGDQLGVGAVAYFDVLPPDVVVPGKL